MESDDESVSDEGGYYDDDEESYESDSDDSDQGMQNIYRVLQETDVREVQNDKIERLSSTLSLSKCEVTKLLYHYRWNDLLLVDEWFADEEKVRTKVGLLHSTTNFFGRDILGTCGICFKSFPLDHHNFYPTVCGHSYCATCWKYYLNISINDGPGCLSLRCPEPKCHAAVVDRGMINKLCSDGERIKYARYFYQSYVEENKKMKWCPRRGCENVVEFEVGNGNYDVTCLCSHAFCWNCAEEPHRPIECDMMAKWSLKNKSESKNMYWIIGNSKRCTKCKRPIEKNEGCMHMRCPCGFQFCWMCLGPRTNKNVTTHKCNIYRVEISKREHEVEEQKRILANTDKEKYEFYYERWHINHKSKQKAIKDLQKMQKNGSDKLNDKLKVIDDELGFVINAWEQIIECRGVLKWSYAYGYYLPEDKVEKKTLFEYLQGQAEAGLEKLHQCLEQELSVFLMDDMEAENQKEAMWDKEDQKQLKSDQQASKVKQEMLEADFRAFRQKLTDLTFVNRLYFENLVRALENNLSEVKPIAKRKQSKFRSRRS